MPKATKATWPREAPFFEFIGECNRCRGYVMEGYVAGNTLWTTSSKCGGDWPADATTVKPLTPAAVAMLEIAKESA